MKKPFKDLTIADIVSICKSKGSCETCPISSQCATLFKHNPESWAYFNKADMTDEVYVNRYESTLYIDTDSFRMELRDAFNSGESHMKTGRFPLVNQPGSK